MGICCRRGGTADNVLPLEAIAADKILVKRREC